MSLTSGETAVVKLQRHGRISFRGVRRTRGYVEDRRHTSWLYLSRLAAAREYLGLQKLYQAGVSVPMPIAHNRHAIIMSAIEGDILADCHRFSRPVALLNRIISAIKTAYAVANIIHSDLSEYNVLITPEHKVLLIDWPQWVSSDHPNWRSYLERDLKNISYYFSRKFGVKRDPKELLANIVEKEYRRPRY